MTPHELDKLVAERVLGHRLTADYAGVWEQDADEVETGAGRDLRPYSTDVGAAWLLVEHLNRAGKIVEVNSYHTTNPAMPGGGPGALVFIRSATGPREPEHSAWGDTVPEAICLAALAAVTAGEGKGNEA